MLSWSRLTRWQKIGLVLAVVAFVGLVVAAFWAMVAFNATAEVRDVFLILIALEVLILDIVLIVLLWQIVRLLFYLVKELAPVIENLQETTGTVRGTAAFMSESVVSPAIEAASKAAALRRSLSVLFNGSSGRHARATRRTAGGDDTRVGSNTSVGQDAVGGK